MELDLTQKLTDVDWLKGLRLLEDGSKESLAELKKMDDTEMVELPAIFK